MGSQVLAEIINFTLMVAKHLNDDQLMTAFEVTDLVKLFDVKSTETPTKVLYHFIFKLAFKLDSGSCSDYSQLLEAQSRGSLCLFSSEEANLMRNCLRENIDQVQASFREIVGIKGYLEGKRETFREDNEVHREFLLEIN